MRIKQVRVYQAVEFERTSHNYFTAKEYMQPSSPNKLKDIDITLLPTGYVRIVSADDVVDVGPGNVAYIQYDREDYETPTAPKVARAKPA